MALDAEANFASPGGNANYPNMDGEKLRERGWNRATLQRWKSKRQCATLIRCSQFLSRETSLQHAILKSEDQKIGRQTVAFVRK